MTFPSWGPLPPPSQPPFHPSNTDTPHHGNLYMMVGSLLEQGRHIIWRLDKIDVRLEAGDQRFDSQEDRMGRIERNQSRSRSEEIPKWERVVKRWAAWLIPASILAGTGQLATALEWARLLK